MSLGVGDTVGRYKLGERLGHGAMAVVFRAEDPSLGREVAIKVLHAHLWDQPHIVTRFQREARAVAALRHPNILEIHDYGTLPAVDDDRPGAGYIVIELVRGCTLREFVARSGSLLPEVAALVALKLAAALGCAHERGIIHRDLKPDNVMIADGGRVVLTDFGLARIVEGEKVTQTGAMLGSPAYMSPEQARGGSVDARSDLFALGTVLYELGTGKLPFAGKDPIATAMRIIEGQFIPAGQRNPQFGRELEQIVNRLLQRDPEARFASAGEVEAVLRAALDDVGVGDADEELQRYFAAPGEYNRELIGRVVTSAAEQARSARDSGEYARALSWCDRVLAYEPENPDALDLVRQLTARGAWRRRIVGAVVALLVGVAVLGGYLLSGGADPSGGGSSALPATRRPGRGPAMDGAPALRDAAARRDVARDATVGRDAGRARDATAPPVVAHRRREPPRRRRRDARVRALPPDVGAPRPRPDAALPRRPRTARLTVRISPWCDLRINGVKRGRSPRKQPFVLPPGRYTIVCRQGSTGLEHRETVVLKAGQQRRIVVKLGKRRVRVRVRLTRGDSVRVNGRVWRNGEVIRPWALRRRRVEVLKKGKQIAAKYLTIPSHDCTLTDSPAIACRR